MRFFVREESWQPYPDHPHVCVLTDELATINARVEKAFHEGVSGVIDWASALDTIRLLDGERTRIKEKLDEVTRVLVQDQTLTPRWVPWTKQDAEQGVIECFACGNLVPAGDFTCAYCGWTYVSESPDAAGEAM